MPLSLEEKKNCMYHTIHRLSVKRFAVQFLLSFEEENPIFSALGTSVIDIYKNHRVSRSHTHAFMSLAQGIIN